MKTDELSALRKQLIDALSGGSSHMKFADAVQDFPAEARGKRLAHSPHSPWELIEHLRIAQRDILDFSRDPKHQSPAFPQGYWPESPAPETEDAWDTSVAAFLNDQRAFADLLGKDDLFAAFPHGDGQNLLREAIVLANHNSYHLGQLLLLKKMIAGS